MENRNLEVDRLFVFLILFHKLYTGFWLQKEFIWQQFSLDLNCMVLPCSFFEEKDYF